VDHHRNSAPRPGELKLAQAVDEYGLIAVLGNRVITARESRDWRLALNVELYYSARDHALLQEDTTAWWGGFIQQYPHADEVLAWAEREYKDYINGR